MQPDKKLRAFKIWRCMVVSSIQFAGFNIQYPCRVNAASQVNFAEVDILATHILKPRMENRRARVMDYRALKSLLQYHTH